MADITLCQDVSCPKFQWCKRAQSKPSQMQSYAIFPRNGDVCEYFIHCEGSNTKN
jgi:hypothetical protein